MIQVQVVRVHISMATTITFVIHIVMKGKSPPSIMCTTTTNDIYYELKQDNDIIITKMLHKRKCTSPNKPYFTPSPSFMSTKEDRETTTTKTVLRLHQPLRHLRQVFSRHLRLWTYGIFAYFARVRLHRLHQVQGDYLRARATTYERGRLFHLPKPLKKDGRAWEIPFDHGDELRGATSYGPPTPRR